MPVKAFAKFYQPISRVLDYLSPLGDLLARFWVAKIFFLAGLTKLQNWDSTLNLFQYVYNVPFMSPHLAAVVGTAAEIILPIMLVLGLGGRLMIFVFFVYNIVAVASYQFLWTPEGAVGFDQHVTWGLLLAMLMFHGPGKLSLDRFLLKKFGHHFS